MQFKIIFVFFIFSYTFSNGQKKFPVLNKFGGVYDVPEATNIIDIKKKYKIVVDVMNAEKNPSTDFNRAYELTARLFNLYALAGLPKGNLDMVVVIHNEASSTILSDESFEKEYKTKNPNTEIINTLGEAGVKFFVCGQSLRARNLVEYSKNPNIQVAHGAILALSHFQSIGYSLLKF